MNSERTSLVRQLEPKEIALINYDDDAVLAKDYTVRKGPGFSKIVSNGHFPFFSRVVRGATLNLKRLGEAYMSTELVGEDELSICVFYVYDECFCENVEVVKININEYIDKLNSSLKKNIDYLNFDIAIIEKDIYDDHLTQKRKVILRVYFDLNEVKKAIEHFNKNA